MYREVPWTLEIEEKSKDIEHKNASEAARHYFDSNINKEVTAKELEGILGYQKAMISIAIKSLLETGRIKIVGFTKCRSLTPIYQSIKGKKKEVKLIDLHENDGTYCSLSTFVKKCKVPSSYYFRTLVEQVEIPSFYAKNPFSIVYYYEDLKELLRNYSKSNKKEWKISFKVFGFEVIVKTPD